MTSFWALLRSVNYALMIPPMGIKQHAVIWWTLLLLGLPTLAVPRPISYVGGHTLMAESGAMFQRMYWHYTPGRRYSLGFSMRHNRMHDETDAVARVAYLVNRRNTRNTQRNLYLKSGVALDNSNNHFISIAGDWESRRLFGSAAWTRVSDGHARYNDLSVQLGVAPYLGEYGDLHTWLMLKSKRDYRLDRRVTYPVVRLFKNSAFVEVGYHQDARLDIHLMYRF